MSVLGAVVMPHNLFLHSEIIQSRQWNLQDEKIIKKQLRFEFADTLFSMIIGWAINSAMILLAAATFFKNGHKVNELATGRKTSGTIAWYECLCCFCCGSSLCRRCILNYSGMAGGSIVSGMYREPYDIKDNHSRIGVISLSCRSLVINIFYRRSF